MDFVLEGEYWCDIDNFVVIVLCDKVFCCCLRYEEYVFDIQVYDIVLVFFVEFESIFVVN